MILFGCLLAFSAAIAPRLVLILAWIFSDRWPVVWGTDFLLPLLGIIFLPYTTIMYLLAWSPTVGGGGGIEGWDWMWIAMGVFLDIWKWSQMWANRQEATKQTQNYYPSGAPRMPTGTGSAAISTGQVPPSTSATSADVDTAPGATEAPPEPPGDKSSSS